MGGALTLRTTAELYPVSVDSRVTAITQAVLTGEKNIDGKPILARELTDDERSFLHERRHRLAEALTRAHDKDIRKSVSEMLAGFTVGKDIPVENAKASITQFIVTLRGLPLWAIERACQKFSRGEITPNDIEGVNRAFGPSTAHLYQVASALCNKFYAELTDVNRALTGVLEHKPTQDEIDRVSAGLRNLADKLKMDIDAEKEAERAPRSAYKSFNDDNLRKIYGRKPAQGDGATNIVKE